MMKPVQLATEVSPFEAKRNVANSAKQGALDAQYWSLQMTAVSAQGDRASFMRIYDHFAPRVQRYLLSLGAADGPAEELTQEALLRLWRKAKLFDPDRASLSTWLYRVARNLYIDQVRREPHWLPIQDGLDWLDKNQPRHGATPPESSFQQDALRQAIDRLPALQAKLLRMNYLESRSHSEISRQLDMPLGSVKSSLRRSFVRLQASMQEPQ